MIISDIVNQLRQELPLYTSLFSDVVNVSSLSRSSGTVTVTANSHGLSAGDEFVLSGAKTPNVITSLTQTAGLGTLITQYNHDITKNSPLRDGDSTYITISGATEDDYNGTFLIMSVPYSNVITFSIDSSAPASATGSPVLEEDISVFFNGRYNVDTVTDINNFTYTITDIPTATSANGTITIKKGIRVSAVKSLEHAVRAYTAQSADNLWAFVVFSSGEVSKNRNTKSDAVTSFRDGIEIYDREYLNISIFVFIPSGDSECQIDEIDTALTVRAYILSSLHTAEFSTGLNDDKTNLVYVGQNFVGEEEHDGFVIWEFRFQAEEFISKADGVAAGYTKALRYFEIDVINDYDENAITAEGDLPDAAQ